MGADAGNEVRDIRDVAPDEHWAHFAEAWRALQSYTYLGKGTPHMDAGVERETMPLRHDMRNTTGGVMAAPLAILAPEPWWLDDDCVPAPVTMSYAVVDPAHDVARLEVVREVVAIGRQLGFSRSHIVDADDHSRLVAVSSGSGVSLGDVPGGFEPVDNPVTELLDSPDLPSLRDAFGMIEGPDGSVQIPSVTPALASPHGALHLGPINIAMEAAATGELTRTLGGDRFQHLGPARDQANGIAFLRHLAGQRRADTVGRAGDVDRPAGRTFTGHSYHLRKSAVARSIAPPSNGDGSA